MRVGTLFLGAATLIVLARLQHKSLRIPNRRTWAHVCVASLFNIVAFSIFTPFAQLHAATSRVAIVVYTMPIWASLLAMPILGERLNATRLVALALCIAGLAILIYPADNHGNPDRAAAGAGGRSELVGWHRLYEMGAARRRSDRDHRMAAHCRICHTCGADADRRGPAQPQRAHGPLLALLFSGVIGAGISYFLWFDIVRRLPATTASLGVLSSPVVGVIASVLMLGERPTLADILGFALMFLASAFVLLRPQETPATSLRK